MSYQLNRDALYIIKGRESVKPRLFQDFLAAAKWKETTAIKPQKGRGIS
jgi:hypothetical protein